MLEKIFLFYIMAGSILYIPLLHAHQIQQNGDKDDYVDLPTGSPVAKGVDFLSTQMILTNAKVMPSEIYISVTYPSMDILQTS